MKVQEMQPLSINNNEDDENQSRINSTCYESCLTVLGKIGGCLGIWLPFPCCFCPKPFIMIPQSSKGIIEKFGKYQRIVDSGLHQYNPTCEKVYVVSLKTQVMDMKRQIVMTNDNVTVDIDTVMFYRIQDLKKAFYTLIDIQFALQQITFSCLRSICGEHTLQEIVDDRQKINDKIESYIEEHVKNWGIYVEEIFIKDMILNIQTVQEMSMIPVSIRKAESKVISSKSDVESAKLLRQAADILQTDAAMQIRYFDVVSQIAEHPNKKTVILPLQREEDVL